jgi:hypothetical protein
MSDISARIASAKKEAESLRDQIKVFARTNTPAHARIGLTPAPLAAAIPFAAGRAGGRAGGRATVDWTSDAALARPALAPALARLRPSGRYFPV